MKKFILLLVIQAVINYGYAQLSGIKTIPGDYASIANAIADLNTQGAGPGGVIFSIASGHTETLPSPTAGLITATGSAANPVIFQNSGGGANPMITAATPGTGSLDGIFIIAGGDYITFDGINIQENPANTTSVMQMEWGYALLKANDTAPIDGCQSVVIKNCTITLNKEHGNCMGIYGGNHTVTSSTTLTLSSTSDAMNHCKFYSNVISNVYKGMFINGYNDPDDQNLLYDQNTEIGVSGGNHISGIGAGSSTKYGIWVDYQDHLLIANNTITGPVDGNGQVRGICIGNGKNSNFDVSSNTISMQYTGTGSFYCIYSYMGIYGTNNTVNIHDNNLSGNTYTNGPSYSTIYGIYQMGSPYQLNIYGNQVNNNTIGSETNNGAYQFYGMYVYPYSPQQNGSITNIYNNTVNGNIRFQSTPSFNQNYFIYVTGLKDICNVYNNQVDNNTLNASSIIGGGIYGSGSSTATLNIYDNSMTNLQIGGQYGFSAIHFQQVPGSAYRNRIENLTSLGTGGSFDGLRIASSPGPNYVFNNFISGIYTPNGTGFNGINLGSSGADIMCCYNTVYLDGSSSDGTFSTSCINHASCNLDLRNNIFVNNSIPGASGKAVAFCRSTSFLEPFLEVSDNNCFYAGIPDPQHLIYWDGTNEDILLNDYKFRVYPRDRNAFSELPPFQNSSTHPYDFHLRQAVVSQCESGGTIVATPLSITTDYDNQPRYPNIGYPAKPGFPPTAPDAGADEYGGMTTDLTPPAIGFTPLANTSSSLNRTMVATITDKNGVPISGTGRPRLYWNINHGTWQPATGVYSGGNQFTFTFGAGATAGDSVFYYIAAQDNVTPTPNVGSAPAYGATGYTANPPACASPPGKPVGYRILYTIAGTFPVGVGQIYQTLQSAVNDLNDKEMVGPVTFVLYDETYNLPNDLTVGILPNVGSGPANTLTIKPNTGITPTVTGNAANGILAILGADYVTIQGSQNNGDDQSLKWVNNNTTAWFTPVIKVGTTVGGITHNTIIKNCYIKGGTIDNGSYGIQVTINNGSHDSIIIHNNTIVKASKGIGYGYASNSQITDNVIGSADDSEKIYATGVSAYYSDNLLIEGNEIMGSPTGLSNNDRPAGIYCDNTPGIRILNNKIHDFHSPGGSGCYGIRINTPDSTFKQIINNIVYNITSGGNGYNSEANAHGILIIEGSNIDIFYNSVYMSGSAVSSYNPFRTSCLYLGSISGSPQVNNLNIKDNIFQNEMTLTPASSKTYLIYANSNITDPFSSIDYNDYHADGTNPNIGYMNGQDLVTLADWQAATGQDINSVDADPMFVSTSDLHPQAVAVNNTGIMIPEVTTDIDGILRTDPPDMGAYEFALIPDLFTSEANPVGQTSATLHGAVRGRNEYVTLSFEYGLTTNYGDEVAATPSQASGNDSIAVSADISGLTINSLYHYRTRGITLTDTAYGPDMTVDMVPSPSISGDTAMCINSGYYYYSTEEGKSGYLWDVSAGGTISWGAGTDEIRVSWTAPGAQWVSVNWANSAGTFAPEPTILNVEVQDYPGAAGSVTGTDSLCAGTYGVPYSVASIGNTVAYVWTLPAGATIATGFGTNNITVDYNLAATSGNISVYGNNLCGNGTPSPPFPMTVFPIPPDPVITQSNDTLFSEAPEGNQWFLEGIILSGATNSYLVPELEGEYWVQVALNGCISDTSNHIMVVFTGVDEPQASNVRIYPVPNSGKFIISMNSTSQAPVDVDVYNNIGIKVYEKLNISPDAGQQITVDLRPVGNGVYIVAVESAGIRVVRRIVVMQ